MKTKKFKKKLSLNKRTVSNLHHEALSSVRGGAGVFDTVKSCMDTCDDKCIERTYPPTECVDDCGPRRTEWESCFPTCDGMGETGLWYCPGC